MNENYDSRFLDYAANTSALSARRVIEIVRDNFTITSVLDVGCARGTWLREWAKAGIGDICGVDGSYADDGHLAIERTRFVSADLVSGFDLGRQFDLVQSLEVGEHLPTQASAAFVATLVRHGRGIVLFSAAPPGQGGAQHINERPYDFWRAHFRDLGYFPVDLIRPKVCRLRDVSFWYRYNTMMYLSEAAIERAPAAVRARVVPDHQRIADVSPRWFRLRKMVVRKLPRSAVMLLARTKAHIHSRRPAGP